jgi:hypothetical protein
MGFTEFFEQKILDFFASPLAGVILFWLFILFVIIGIFVAIISGLRKKHRLEVASGLKIFQILLPKEAAEKKGEMDRSRTLAEIQEDIAVMENLFSAVGSLRPESGWHAMIHGRHDVFSFEIIAKDGAIYFYAATPAEYADYIVEQIYAQFPLAQVAEVPDYNIFSAQGVVQAGVLRFARQNFFPIRTYKKQESDSLNGLTNVLSKIEKGDGAAVQIIMRPTGDGLRKRGRGIAAKIQQGKKVNEVLAESTFTGQLGSIFKTGGAAPKKEGDSYRLSPLEEDMVRALEEKASKAQVEANLRVVVSARDEATVRTHIANIFNSFGQFNLYQYGNTFKRTSPSRDKLISDFIFRHFNKKQITILNTEELSSLYHFPLPTSEAPNIAWLLTRQAPPPLNIPSEGIILGKTVYRGKATIIKMKTADRLRHTYIIGRSGGGKSWLQQKMAMQDIEMGNGLCVIDPHGDFCDGLIKAIPKERAEDLIYFNPADTARPMGINLLEYDPKYPEQKTFVINEMINIFDKLYDLKSTGGPMFEQYMRNAMLLLMEDPESGSTLMEISKVMADPDFRKYKLSKCKNRIVFDFWTKEAEKAGGEAALANMVPYITSKLTQFIANDTMRPIIGQQKSAFNFREAMDSKKIILVNLSKGLIGDLNAYLLGLVIVGKILAAALSRADMNEKERLPFFLYIDEFQNFTTDSIATILSEARKYGLGLVIAHQFIGQLVKNNNTYIRDSVFGNAGTMIAFRIGADDADFLEREFAPTYNARDLLNIEKFNVYIKLLIDNTASRPFNMQTLPIPMGNPSLGEKIKQLARLKYGRDRRLVELEIKKRTIV